MTERDIDDVAQEVIRLVLPWAVARFQDGIEKSGLVLTGDLKNSFDTKLVIETKLIAGEIEFLEYGRLRDMKSLTWDSVADVDAIEEWVKKVGVDKFAYVPGYKSNRVPISRDIAVRRIASAIARAKMRVPLNRYGQGWYNKNKMLAFNYMKSLYMKKLSRFVADNVVKAAEGG